MSFCLRSFLCHLLGQFLNKIKVEDMKVNGRKSNLSLLNNIFFWREKKNYNYLDIGKAFAILFCRKLPFKSAQHNHAVGSDLASASGLQTLLKRKDCAERFLHKAALKAMPMDCSCATTSLEAFTK